MKNILLALATLGAALSLSTAMADDGAALFKSKPCAACHTIDSKMVGPALKEVDFTVIQTFSFYQADKTVLSQFMKYLAQVSPIRHIDEIRAPVGVAHAYDMAHILARAINLARSTDRTKIRAALENVREYRGLIRLYKPPFTASRHEALGADELLMTRYRKDGVLVPVPQ